MKSSRTLFLLLFLLAGCSSMLTTKAPAPVYYQLEYKAVPVRCDQPFQRGVRVWDFTAASPFDRPEMVAAKTGAEVQFSGNYQWVAPPGALLAQQLGRDLSAGNLFPQVITGDNPAMVPLELSGRVYQFAWEEEGKNSRAVLKVEVSLVQTSPAREVLFHQIYNLQSPASQGDNSALFAQAMGGLAGRLSEKLRRDLCGVAVTDKGE